MFIRKHHMISIIYKLTRTDDMFVLFYVIMNKILRRIYIIFGFFIHIIDSSFNKCYN